MIFVYCSKITNRVRYIFSLYFDEILGVSIKITDNIEDFKSYKGPKISYTLQAIDDELFFLSKSLLFENDIKQLDINVFEWEGMKVFFPTNKYSALPFDPFSAGFYLVSRYEEYLPHLEDKYDRFEARESFAYQHDFIKKPLLNIWAKLLKKILLNRYPELIFREAKYQFISTIDIDNAYAYREKGFIRNFGAFSKAIINLNTQELKSEPKSYFGLLRIPMILMIFSLPFKRNINLNQYIFFYWLIMA